MKSKQIQDCNGWFTIEEIDSNTFAISEYGHWENAHSYLLIGRSRACLIDTGTGIGNIKEVTDSLTDLPVQVVTTHVHWDHIGGHGFFTELAVHFADAEWLRGGLPIPLHMIRRSLLQEPLTRPAPAGFDPAGYRPFTGEPARLLHDGDLIDLGERTLRILHTPGHSPGHICLYEAERGYLYTGDLIYQGTLYAFYPSTDPLAFAASVQRLCELSEVRRILPGHNELKLPDGFLQAVNEAFQKLKANGLLRQGTGLHSFEKFNIKL